MTKTERLSDELCEEAVNRFVRTVALSFLANESKDQARAKGAAAMRAVLAPGMAPKVSVAGAVLPMTIAEFERRCLVAIEELQQQPNFDSALLGLLCDAVRLAREFDQQPAVLAG